MKNDSHRELLDDLYHPSGSGPNCDTVLGMVRAHRTSRRRRRNAAGLALLVAIGSALFFTRDIPQPAPPQLTARTPPMRHIDDEELLEMFDGQPAAIATLPDGSKRLLLLVNTGR
jgi:hypothetical protein